MQTADAQETLREVEQRALLVAPRPVEPADLVVLAVGVVVPALRAAILVACDDHGRTLRQQHGREQVTALPTSQRVDALVVRGAFDPAVPRVLVIVPVLIVLAVLVVVLLVVRDEIIQREAVVRGDEVDARRGRTTAELIEIAAARQAVTDLGGFVAFATPERAYRIAI